MRVIATKKGFYNDCLVEAGEEFYVEDGLTASWFVPVKTESEVATESEVESDNKSNITVKQIKERLDEMGVSYPDNANKETLLALLQEHDA